MNHSHLYISGLVALLRVSMVASPLDAATATPVELTITLENHVFQPATLTAPVGQKIHLTIINRDDSEEEFDSDDLGREVWLKPKGQGEAYFGPLKAGRYSFQGEMHGSTAQGTFNVQ